MDAWVCLILLLVGPLPLEASNGWQKAKDFESTFGSRFYLDAPGAVEAAAATSNSSAVVYNYESEICCRGRVYPRPNIYSYVSCCGSYQYSISQDVCCSGVPHRMKDHYVCCGDKYHSPRDSICCYHPYSGESFVSSLKPGAAEHMLCCGIRAYDTRTHICCTMEVSENGPVRPGTDQYVDRVTRFIIYDRKYRHAGCCRGKVYNSEAGSCSELHTTARSLWSRLRNDRLHPVGICGHLPYNTKSHWCCTGPTNDNNPKSSIEHRISSMPCCGLKQYDEETQVCCGGVLQVQNTYGSLVCCYNGGLYDARKEECCDNSHNVIVLEKMDGGDMCCGNMNIPYQSHRQSCCGNKVLDIPQFGYGEYQCCQNSNNVKQVVLYLKGQEICCSGVKYFLTERHTHCCGQEAYAPEAELCCDGKLFPKVTQYDSCCGERPYNGKTEVCCGKEEWSKMKRDQFKKNCCMLSVGARRRTQCHCNVLDPEIYPRVHQTNACCGFQMYDTSVNHCCNSTVIDKDHYMCCWLRDPISWDPVEHIVEKTNSKSQCCGIAAYNPSTQLCCNGVVIASIGVEDIGCCGNSVYNRQTQMCCNITVHEKTDGKHDKCCGNRIHDPNHEICCEETEEIFAVEDKRIGAECCYE